jgi:hypothetical protein
LERKEEKEKGFQGLSVGSQTLGKILTNPDIKKG